MRTMYRSPSVVNLCLVLLFGLVSMTSCTLSISGNTTMLRGEYVAYTGDFIALRCSSSDSNVDSTKMEFTYSGDSLPSDVIDSRTRELVIDAAKCEIACVSYGCQTSSQSQLSMPQRVCVAARPPANITDFKCISRNLETLTCSWNSKANIIDETFTLKQYINDQWSQCIVTTRSPKKQCSWNTVESEQRYRVELDTLDFELTYKNELNDSMTPQYFTIPHYSIVQLNSLQLEVTQIRPHEVELQWKMQKTLIRRLKNVMFKISYTIPKYNNTPHKVDDNVETWSVEEYSVSMRLKLSELPYAHAEYLVSVSVKPAQAADEFWSAPALLSFTTASEAPRRPPELPTGAFKQNSFEQQLGISRYFSVYWKPLEDNEEAGLNFKYSYKIHGPTNCSVQTTNCKSNCSVRQENYLNLQCQTSEAMHITIWSENEKGPSANRSTLYIPSIKDTDVKVMKFTTLAHENGTYDLSWRNMDPVDNYTVFWHRPKSCPDRFDYAVIDPDADNYTITLPNDQNDYEFAISANVGMSSSGMIASKCRLVQKSLQMNEFSINFNYDESSLGNTSVRLQWSLNCLFKEGIITGYNITNSKTDAVTSNWHYIDDPKRTSAVVTDLLPFTTYEFEINVNTIFGLSSGNNAKVKLKTKEGIPLMPQKVKAVGTTNTSINLNILQPAHFNGPEYNIKYVFYNHSTEFRRQKINNTIVLDGLLSYTNYSITMKVCNEYLIVCSNETTAINVRTKIGNPGELQDVTLEDVMLSWKPPVPPGGNVHKYQVKIITDQGKPEIKEVDAGALNYITETCPRDTNTYRKFQVRAVNLDGNVPYLGPWSKELFNPCRGMSTTTIISTVMATFVILALMYVLTKYRIKMKKINDLGEPIFPPGLMLPWENPNNTYGKFNDNITLGSKQVPYKEKLAVKSDSHEMDVSDPLLRTHNKNESLLLTTNEEKIVTNNNSYISDKNNIEDAQIIKSPPLPARPTLNNGLKVSNTLQNNLNDRSILSRMPNRNMSSITNVVMPPIRAIEDYVKLSLPSFKGIVSPPTSRNAGTASNTESGYVQAGIDATSCNVSSARPVALKASSRKPGYVTASFTPATLVVPSSKRTEDTTPNTAPVLPVASRPIASPLGYVLAAPTSINSLCPFETATTLSEKPGLDLEKSSQLKTSPSTYPVLRSKTEPLEKSVNASGYVLAVPLNLPTSKTVLSPLTVSPTNTTPASMASNSGYVQNVPLNFLTSATPTTLSIVLPTETKSSEKIPNNTGYVQAVPVIPSPRTQSVSSTVSNTDNNPLTKSVTFENVTSLANNCSFSTPQPEPTNKPTENAQSTSGYVQASLIPSSQPILSNIEGPTAKNSSGYVQLGKDPHISVPKTGLLSPVKSLPLKDSLANICSFDYEDMRGSMPSLNHVESSKDQTLKSKGYVHLNDVIR